MNNKSYNTWIAYGSRFAIYSYIDLYFAIMLNDGGKTPSNYYLGTLLLIILIYVLPILSVTFNIYGLFTMDKKRERGILVAIISIVYTLPILILFAFRIGQTIYQYFF